jgi:phage terminase large subunit-like protein
VRPPLLGTGYVPRSKIIGKPSCRQCGIADVVDQIQVRHVSGGISTLQFKSFQQGWEVFQGDEPHMVWLDEQPRDNENERRIFSECQTRVLTSHGIIMVTFTALLGRTEMVEHFEQGGPGVYMDTATWHDVPHLNEHEKDRLRAGYPVAEIETRTMGGVMMGEGRVFSVPEADILCAPFHIPPHFAIIKGIDFGVQHPAAVVTIAWDRDKDTIYLTRAWKQVCKTDEHAAEINAADVWAPVAWPHDGDNREKSGERIRDLYVPYGCRFLSMSARYKNDDGGSQPVEPIVIEVDQRMRAGQIKVFSTCSKFFDEYRQYHRVNGKLVDRHDDILKAFFYAVIMRRFAQIPMNAGYVAHYDTPAGLSMRIN